MTEPYASRAGAEPASPPPPAGPPVGQGALEAAPAPPHLPTGDGLAAGADALAGQRTSTSAEALAGRRAPRRLYGRSFPGTAPPWRRHR